MVVISCFAAELLRPCRHIDATNIPTWWLFGKNPLDFGVVIEGHSIIIPNLSRLAAHTRICYYWYMKELTRSTTNKKIAGVCGGLAEYFNIDYNVIRVIFVLLILPEKKPIS
jgi:hypothetical protein